MLLWDPRRRVRTRNFLVLAIILSVFVHLVGGALWELLSRMLARAAPPRVFSASLQEPPPKADVIRIERHPKTAARAAHENRVAVTAPRPHPLTTIVPAAPHVRHELARIRLHAPAQPPPAHITAPAAQPPRRLKPVALAPLPDSRPALSDRQIAQLGQDFSKAIADSRQTLAGAQAQSERTPVTTVKHYDVHFSGIHEGLNPGDGEIIEISRQRIGDTMWYYTRYTYVHSDGTYESDEIPWPFHYPLNNDPFARHDKRIPLQAPPPGYKPDRALKPILEQYFGGPPVTD